MLVHTALREVETPHSTASRRALSSLLTKIIVAGYATGQRADSATEALALYCESKGLL